MRTNKRRLGKLLLAALMVQALPMSGQQTSRLLINEVEVANIDAYIDPSFNYGGWIELYNAGSSAQSLVGMQLRHTDSEGVVSVHRLSSTHGTVQAGGFVNLWFDHNSADGYFGSGAAQQVRYKLDPDGGLLELLATNGSLIDAVSYPAAIARCSWARTTDGGSEWGYTSQPTPAATNTSSRFSTVRLDAPVVDTDGQLFTEPFQFSVAIPDGETLYYTTDGSTPMVGVSSVSVDGRFSVSTTTVYRFMLSRSGCLNSPVVTRTFILNDRGYYLPVLCVNSNPKNFFDNTIGLYVRGTNGRTWNNSKTPANQNMDWERPVNVEYLVPNSECNVYRSMLNQGANFSIFGGWTRFNAGDDYWEYKSSFKLKADRLSDGENYFTADIFDSKPFTKQKHLLVRNGGQDQYERFWDAALQEMIRTSGLYLDCQAYQPSHVFINGRYLGMLNLREVSNRKYAYSNYGIGDEEIDQWEDELTMKAGDAKKVNRWMALCNEIGAYPTDTAVWNNICRVVDVDEYCNYMAAETYMGNLDWLRAGLKNIKGFSARTDDGKIHIVVLDLDGCFGATDMLSQVMSKSSKLCTIFKNMMKYEPFRRQFVDAYCIVGGSVFLPNRCVPLINAITARVAPALALEGHTVTTRRDRLIATLTDRNGHYKSAMNTLRTALSLPQPYVMTLGANTPHARLKLNNQEIPTSHFDGQMFPPFTLTASAPAGYSFKAWVVGTDTVSTDSVIQFTTMLKQGTYDVTAVFDSITTASGRIRAGVPPIRINEVSSANDIYVDEYFKKGDWVELYNTTSDPIDIAGMYLSDKPQQPLKYQIPNSGNTIVPPHGFRIVWCDSSEPMSELHTSFKLANTDSAFVSITAADESWSDRFYYQAQARWQSFGRYPDGSNNVALFDRITIGNPNSTNTHTAVVERMPDYNQASAINNTPTRAGGRIKSVTYYNVNGQQVSGPEQQRIVIQKITYDNGYSEVRKVYRQH